MCSLGTKQRLKCSDTCARIGHPNPNGMRANVQMLVSHFYFLKNILHTTLPEQPLLSESQTRGDGLSKADRRGRVF